MEQTIFSRTFARRLLYLSAATVTFACMLGAILGGAAVNEGTPAWSDPSAMALRKASQTTGAQNEPVLLNNLGCSLLTYRLVANSGMRAGCFTETAFGLLDTDNSTIIFNGTDEGLSLQPYTARQVIAPWPKALNLIGLDPVDNNGGTLVSLYKNPLAIMKDQRNFAGQLIAKKLDRPPDMTLKDGSGKPLVINPQTLTFSEDGAWLVAETLGGSFVRINLATLAMTAFAPAYSSLGSPALLKSRLAVGSNGRFVAIANDAVAAFRVYDLATCTGTPNNLQPLNCRSYDYRPFVRQDVNGLQSVRQIRFLNDGLLRFDVLASEPGKNGTYLLAPAAAITSLTDYLGLGDSYTSGEGAFNYLDGTDTPDNLCHLSRHAYPLLLTHDLFEGSGGRSVACSGAVIRDIASMSGSYRGQARNAGSLEQLQQSQPQFLESVETNFLPGYVAQQRFVQRWQPGIITVGIGGNDIGFGHIVQTCVMPHISWRSDGNTCYRSYEDRLELTRLIDRTVPRWSALYAQLKRQAPGTRLYAIGYPQVAVTDGACARNVHLNKDELKLAAEIIDYLNKSIRQAAAASGISYVDISQALAGHRLCETASHNIAVNGLTAGTDAGVLKTGPIGKESYHPNALGHLLIAEAIRAQTRNFTSTAPPNSKDDAPSGLLDAPVSGRPLSILFAADNLTKHIAGKGGVMTVQADGSIYGLRAGAPYTVHVDGPAGRVIGALTSGPASHIEGTVTIPTDTAPGSHTIDIIGENQNGERVDIRQPVYIPVSDADIDGDGVDTMLDPCPAAVNGGHDQDQDGIDDVCDGWIGQPPGPGLTTTNTASTHLYPGPDRAAYILGAASLNPRMTGPLGFSLAAIMARDRPMAHQSAWLILAFILLSVLVAKKYIQKIKYRLQWLYMSRVRKGFIYLLSLCLLATLIGTAVSISTNNTLGKPEKVQKALSDSKIYEHFISYTSDQAKKTNGDTDQTGSVSLSDAAVKAAAESAFSPKLIEQSVNTFIESNYAWLEGKTPKPEFAIDLTVQKQTFAQKVGAYVTTYTAGLPVCANDQIAAQQSQDPLAASCRPANTTPEAVGAQVTQTLSTTGDFLSNPVITANTVNPDAAQQSEPYYEKLQHLPKAYQFGQKLPYILAGLSVLLALAIVFLSPERRRGLRKVGIVLLIAGLSLVALKFFADLAFRRIENRVFNDANNGQLQQSLTDFAHRIEESMVRIDLWFGIGFLLLATVIFIALTVTRQKDGDSGKPATPADSDGGEEPDAPAPIVLTRKRLTPKPGGPKLGGAPPASETPAPKQPKKPRRLVQ